MLYDPVRTLTTISMWLFLASCASTQDGSSSWSGGARHQQISDTEFVVTSTTNGASGPARLRPLLIGRARHIATAAGYSGFLIRRPILERSRFGEGYVATATVKLVQFESTATPESEYFSTSLRSVEQAPVQDEVATLVGSRASESSERSGSFSPWYVDAVESSGGFFGTRTLSLRAGNQLIGVYYFVCKPYVSDCIQGSLMLRATLVAGGTYRVAGEVKGGMALAWIEDTKTGAGVEQLRVSN